jgi:hypothetical protein
MLPYEIPRGMPFVLGRFMATMPVLRDQLPSLVLTGFR